MPLFIIILVTLVKKVISEYTSSYFTVKGVQCLVTSVKPARNLHKDDSRSDVTGSNVTGSVAAGSDVTESDVTRLIVDAGEKEEDKSPSQEFTRVCLERNVQGECEVTGQV